MIRTATNPRLRAGLAAAVILSLAGVVASAWAFVSTQSAISRQLAFATQADAYLSAIKDHETGYRGFAVTGAEDFLEPYHEALRQLPVLRAQLDAAATDAGLEPVELDSLYKATQFKVSFGEQVLAARKQSFDAAQSLILTRQGKAEMDLARATVQKLLDSSSFAVARSTNNMKRWFLPLGAASLLILALAAGLLFYLASKARMLTVRSRSLLTNVIERAPVGLALLDRDTKIDQMNMTFARMVSGKRDKIAGTPLSSLSPALSDKLGARIRDALEGRRGWKNADEDFIIELSIGEGTRYLKADVFPVTLLTASGQEAQGAGIVLNDFTRQREWEIEMEEAKASAEAANRAKSTFLANMSHELRTPLTAVLGYTELIEDDLRDQGSTEILADLNKITVNARHLLQLINDVLDLSKIEAQKMDVHSVDFTLKSLFTEVEAATGSLVSKNDNSMIMEADNPDAVLHTDDLKVKQILLNVISNASKFTSNGQIRLSANSLTIDGVAHTRFVVNDNGIGMSKEQLANLFQRFTQADETTTRKYGGTGLGLALTRALSRMLGGTIEVESAEGQGTTFTITIPSNYTRQAAVVAEDEAKASNSAMLRHHQPDTPSVLVVDDEQPAREVLERHLMREGFAVQTASSGTQALEMIAAKPPLAVLLDVMMPGLDGWHVLKAIRTNPATAKIPVIMTTVLDEQNFAYAMGASGYLKKPVRRADMAEALQGAATVGGRHVLIVDDDTDACERLREMLERDGWNVRIANNGATGLAAMADKVPDLVLVDLVMPEMDGYSFIREVRKSERYSAVPLVVMTAEDITTKKVRQLSEQTEGIVQKGAMPMSDLVADLRRYAQAANS